jgi:SAM-dependent methyltransferase
MPDALFWEIHGGHEREGPGDEASLRRALAAMTDLPADAEILDIGCGPGAQSLALAAQTTARITAVDLHQRFLDALDHAAAARGLAGRITTVRASMTELPFADGAFDAVWSEGAIYNMGFARGLAAWKRLLRPGGYLAVSEICWLRPIAEIPAEALAQWADYPAMTTADVLLRSVAEAGYRALDHFVLPPSAWWNYYDPLEARIAALRQRYRDDPAKRAGLDAHQGEIDGYRRFGEFYSYLFVVMQAP